MTVIAADDDAFEAGPATEKMLLDAIAQCERGETVPLKQVLSDFELGSSAQHEAASSGQVNGQSFTEGLTRPRLSTFLPSGVPVSGAPPCPPESMC